MKLIQISVRQKHVCLSWIILRLTEEVSFKQSFFHCPKPIKLSEGFNFIYFKALAEVSGKYWNKKAKAKWAIKHIFF